MSAHFWASIECSDSSLCISLAMLLFGITLIGSRNPKPLPWARDFLVADVYVPVMAGLVFFGLFGIVRFIADLPSSPINVVEVLGAAAILLAAVGCLKLMRIKKSWGNLKPRNDMPRHRT
ncbi:MAG: hypothetical protein WAM73_00430 [Desulfobacterales bacterium]